MYGIPLVSGKIFLKYTLVTTSISGWGKLPETTLLMVRGAGGAPGGGGSSSGGGNGSNGSVGGDSSFGASILFRAYNGVGVGATIGLSSPGAGGGLTDVIVTSGVTGVGGSNGGEGGSCGYGAGGIGAPSLNTGGNGNTAAGGGGGGAGAGGSGGGGGSSSFIGQPRVINTPDTTYAIIIGAGGAGGTGSYVGGNGGGGFVEIWEYM